MKKFSKLTSIILLAIISLTSCTKEDTESNIEETTGDVAIKTITDNLKSKMSQITQPDDLSLDRNMIQDFGFTFIYPINLTYNNDVKVSINSSSELLNIVNGLTETSYIKSIDYPFNIDDQNTSRTNTSIDNEAELQSSIDSHDSDGDGTPNYADDDDDNDTVADQDEDVNHDGDVTNDDTDNDGVTNINDTDDDGDGVATANEDYDGDGDVAGGDADNDGTPDYLDTDSDNDGMEDAQDNDADGDGNIDDDENNDSDDDNDSDSNN